MDIEAIIARRKEGINHTLEDSNTIKDYVKKYLANPNFGSTEVFQEIEDLFPIEFGIVWGER